MAVYLLSSFPGFPGGRGDGSLAVRMPFASAAACCIHLLVHSPTARLQRCHGAALPARPPALLEVLWGTQTNETARVYV